MSQDLAEQVASQFGDDVYGVSEHGSRWYVDVRRDAALPALRFAHDTLGMNYLVDVTCVDTLQINDERPERFELIYVLRNLDSLDELVVRAFVPEDDPTIDSATGLWRAADWLEREVYDMFGIEFRGHPNMIRILTPENFEGHPLRKDFPTQGIGYRDNFPIITRDEA